MDDLKPLTMIISGGVEVELISADTRAVLSQINPDAIKASIKEAVIGTYHGVQLIDGSKIKPKGAHDLYYVPGSMKELLIYWRTKR